MSKSVITSFIHGKTIYSQMIDTVADAVTLQDDEEVILTVDSNAKLFDSDGELLGDFRLYGNKSNWCFMSIDGEQTNYSTMNLLKCELEYFKQYVKEMM